MMKMKLLQRLWLLAVATCVAGTAHAQQIGVNSSYEGCDYTEATDNSTASSNQWNKLEDKLYITWASRDVHYKKKEVPTVTDTSLELTTDKQVSAWRGERLGMEALLYTKSGVSDKLALRADVGSSTLECTPRFMNYVITDSKQGCDTNNMKRPQYLVPDIIDIETSKSIDAKTVRPVWVTVEVPHDIAAGNYDVKIDVVNTSTSEIVGTLNLRVVVCNRTLPLPQDQQFFLNFWQQPYALSRYYEVDNWSDAHMEILKPYLKMMARAGQKTISAIMFYEPWGDQSNDKFQAMIKTTQTGNNSYTYDYTIFDKWVELNMECGITDEIHCFSMIPWDNSFVYYDANGNQKTLKANTGTTVYNNFWSAFLKAFAAHLTEKGWLDKTVMALDERSSGDTQNVINLMNTLNLGIKLSLAGAYNSSLATQLYDYSLEAPKYGLSASEISSRKAKGYRSTIYTCCSALDPNIITNNHPADGAYLPIHAISQGYDGYLHWSWCNWTDDPLIDCRFKLWGGGDCYLVYPGNRSGVRFERIIEGVQLAEKVRILREAYTNAGDSEALSTLNTQVAKFESGNVNSSATDPLSSAGLVNTLQAIVNESSIEEGGDDDEEDSYCTVSLLSTNKETAIAKRWLTSVTTLGAAQDLAYTASAASTDGYVLCQEGLQVRPGTTFTLRTVATTNDDDLRYCLLNMFADWNGDYIFADTEKIASLGTLNAGNTDLLDHTFTITVPDDAAPGLVRIRLCYGDAWGSWPDACDQLLKGFAFDIPVRILNDGVFYFDEDNSSVEVLKSQVDAAKRPLYLRRSLSAAKWNSLMLPVSLDAAAVRAAFGDDVILSRLQSVDLTNGYCVNFKKVDLDTASPALEAGTLYIIKPGAGMAPLADGSYTFTYMDKRNESGVSEDPLTLTIANGSPVVFRFDEVEYSSIDVDDTGIKEQAVDPSGSIRFRGTYVLKNEEGLIPAQSFVLGASDGAWYHTTSPISTVRGFRTWIDTSGVPAGAKISFVVDGVDDGDVTGIGLTENDSRESQDVYDLNGRKIRSGGDTCGLAKGVYVVNGKKFVLR